MSTDKQEYGRQLLALIRKLTESDGTVTRNERAWLGLLRQEFGMKEAPGADFDAQALKAAVQGENEARELVQLLLMVSLSDGQTTPDEWSLIQEIGRLVGVSDEQLETLRRETVLAVEP